MAVLIDQAIIVSQKEGMWRINFSRPFSSSSRRHQQHHKATCCSLVPDTDPSPVPKTLGMPKEHTGTIMHFVHLSRPKSFPGAQIVAGRSLSMSFVGVCISASSLPSSPLVIGTRLRPTRTLAQRNRTLPRRGLHPLDPPEPHVLLLERRHQRRDVQRLHTQSACQRKSTM